MVVSRFSNSSIKTYEQCPYKFKLTRIEGLTEPAGEAAERGKTIHLSFEKAIKNQEALPQEFEHWNTYIDKLKSLNARAEEEFAITKDWQVCKFDDDKAWLRGVIDAIYTVDDSIHILDWKTGKERDYADQVNLYAGILFAMYPEIKKISTEICYIDLKKQINYGYVYREKAEELKQWICDRVTKIENDDIFAPNPTYGCRWCHFRKSNGGPCQW